ncbi:hypothetical protein, partial [Staphylococcus aureus]
SLDLVVHLSLIHISEPTRHAQISYAVFCLKKIFLIIRRPPRSTRVRSSAASDVYKRFNDTATTEIYTYVDVGS